MKTIKITADEIGITIVEGICLHIGCCECPARNKSWGKCRKTLKQYIKQHGLTIVIEND